MLEGLGLALPSHLEKNSILGTMLRYARVQCSGMVDMLQALGA